MVQSFFGAHSYLRVADKTFRVGREPTPIREEFVQRALCDGAQFTWLGSQKGPDARAHKHQDRAFRQAWPLP